MQKRCDGVLFDIDGTILLDGMLLAGAKEAVQFCMENDIPYVFVTNTTSKSAAELHSELISCGIEVTVDHIINPVVAVKEYLSARKIKEIQIVHCRALEPSFHDFDFSDTPEVIILAADGTGLSFRQMNEIFRMARNGAKVVTLQRNKFYMKQQEMTLDLGFYVAGFEYVLDTEIENFGKPSSALFSVALHRLGTDSPEHCMIVGDDLEFDIISPQKQGFTGVLVKTGKYEPFIETQFTEKADHTCDTLTEFPSLFQG